MTRHVVKLISNEPMSDEDMFVDTVALPKPEIGELWLHFTKEESPDRAAEMFRKRFGYYPKHTMMFLGSRCCGPIEVTR